MFLSAVHQLFLSGHVFMHVYFLKNHFWMRFQQTRCEENTADVSLSEITCHFYCVHAVSPHLLQPLETLYFLVRQKETF